MNGFPRAGVLHFYTLNPTNYTIIVLIIHGKFQSFIRLINLIFLRLEGAPPVYLFILQVDNHFPKKCTFPIFSFLIDFMKTLREYSFTL